MSKLKYISSSIIKFFAKIYLLRVFKVKYVYGDISIKKNESYFLIGNHVLLLDAFFSDFAIKGYAVPVVNSFVFTKRVPRIVLTKFADAIVKRKGQSDTQTIRDIKKFVKQGRPIAIYPEGNASYYGETIESVYATAKLIKIQKIDVLCAKVKGGYLAKPRWRNKRIKNAYIELEMFSLFSSEEIKKLSVEEIYQKMTESYYQNDYEWNKDKQIKYLGKDRLKGSHRVIYGCPNCNSINTIESFGDEIHCVNCNTTGIINDFGFIENTKFDNFVEWGKYQENILRLNLDLKLSFDVELYKYDLDIFKKYFIGKANLTYDNCKFVISNKVINMEFCIKDIKGEVYSEALDFSFDYKDVTFMIRSEHPKLLLDLTTLNKEEHKCLT